MSHHLPEGREVMIVAIVDAELIVDVEVSVEPAAREKIKVRAARSWGLAIEKMVCLVELSLCLSRVYLGKTIVSSIKMAHKKGVFRTWPSRTKWAKVSQVELLIAKAVACVSIRSPNISIIPPSDWISA